MHVFVFTITGLCVLVNHIEPTMTVEQLKARLYDALQYPPDQMRIVRNGVSMDDGRDIRDYNVSPGDLLFLVMRLRGC